MRRLPMLLELIRFLPSGSYSSFFGILRSSQALSVLPVAPLRGTLNHENAQGHFRSLGAHR